LTPDFNCYIACNYPNVHRASKTIHLTFDHNFGKCRPFRWQSPNETVYELLQGIPSRLKCVATQPCKIQKSKITAELLLIPSKLIGFTW